MEAKNAKYTADGTIDLEINHPQYGWIPFTASPDDVEQLGRELFLECKQGLHGTVVPYVVSPKTPAEVLAEKKAERAALVAAITVTTSSGRVFDGDEVSQGRLARAIQTMEYTNQATTKWILADNTVDLFVPISDMREALMLAGVEQSRIWSMPYE